MNEKIKEILTNEKKFAAFINKKYLDLTEEKFNVVCIKINKNDIEHVAKDNKIVNKIKALFKIEKIMVMERFKINEIDKTNVLNDVKTMLIADIESIILLYDYIGSKNKTTARILHKINGITYNDQLQEFIAECYNTFGELIEYTSKKVKTVSQKIISSRVKYSDFKLME